MTSVLMTAEGTYPYSAGGVSTWCDALLRNTPDVRYRLLPVMMNPHIEAKYEPPRDGDIRDSQADITQAREILGYDPQVSFEEGLARTFEWYRSTQTRALAK